MKNTMLKQAVVWLLIVSPIWWTSGCYTTREITKQDAPKYKEIGVLTKADKLFKFNNWKFDAQGGISGNAKWTTPIDRPGVYGVEETEGYLTLPADSIKTVITYDFDIGLTTLIVVPVGLVVGFLIWGLTYRFDFFGPSEDDTTN